MRARRRLMAVATAALFAASPLTAPAADASIQLPDPGRGDTGPLAGLRVAIDPGHNGANAEHPQQINRLVPNGRGGRKACNTTGTASRAGYPEHKAVWQIAQRVKRILRARGATVTMSRRSDSGVGPFVQRRGRWPQRHHADVLVSIHADGSTDPSVRGMHVARSWPPLSRSQRQPSRRLAHAVRAAFRHADLAVNRAYGSRGIVLRSDLATLNHARRPAVLVEVAEMSNRRDARLLSRPKGRARYAHAIVGALRRWSS